MWKRFAYLTWLAAGCATSVTSETISEPAPQLMVMEPQQDAVLSDPLVRVTGRVENLDSGQVMVGGAPVQLDNDGVFQTTLELAEGDHTIEVTAGPRHEAVEVVVDTERPIVVIESPQPGTYIEGERLIIEGHVVDASRVTLRDERGGEIETGYEGRFAVERPVLPGSHRVRLIATDQAGRMGSAFTTVMAGPFAAPEEPVVDAFALGMGADALRTVAAAVEPHISPEAVRPLVRQANPVAEGWWGEVNVTGETHDLVDLHLTPGDGTLEVRLAVPNIRVPFEADVSFTIGGEVRVDHAVLVAQTRVGAADGLPTVEIIESNLDLVGMLIDVDGLWDYVDRFVITRALSDTIEDALRDAVRSELPKALAEALDELPTEREFSIMDYRVRVNGAISDLTARPGGLSTHIDFAVSAAEPQMNALADEVPGTIVTGGAVAPDVMVDSGVTGGVALDLLNAALFTAWQVGALELRLDDERGPGGVPLTVSTVGHLVPVDPGLDPTAPVAMEVYGELPPVLLRGRGGSLEVAASDIRVQFLTTGDGQEHVFMTLSVGVTGTLVPHIEAGQLGLTIEDFTLMVDTLDQGPEAPEPGALDGTLTEILMPLLETWLELRGLQIPTIQGVRTYARDVLVEDGYLTFEGQFQRAR